MPALTFLVASLFELRIYLDLNGVRIGVAADPSEGLDTMVCGEGSKAVGGDVILNSKIGLYISKAYLARDWINAVIGIAVSVLQ